MQVDCWSIRIDPSEERLSPPRSDQCQTSAIAFWAADSLWGAQLGKVQWARNVDHHTIMLTIMLTTIILTIMLTIPEAERFSLGSTVEKSPRARKVCHPILHHNIGLTKFCHPILHHNMDLTKFCHPILHHNIGDTWTADSFWRTELRKVLGTEKVFFDLRATLRTT